MTADRRNEAGGRQAAIEHVPDDCVVGVGTGSTVNFFIDELAKIKGRIDGAVSSSQRLRRAPAGGSAFRCST